METPNAGATQSVDPFWFLENVDNSEARLGQANFPNDGQQTQQTQEMDNWYTDKSKSEEKSPRESNKLEVESSVSKQGTDQSEPDKDEFSDLERSLFGDSKEERADLVSETPKGSEKQSTMHGLSNNRTTINLDLQDLIGQQKNPKIIIKVNESGSGKHSGGERIIEIDASSLAKQLFPGISIGKEDKSNIPIIVDSKESFKVDTTNDVSNYSKSDEIDIQSLLVDQKTRTFDNYVSSDGANTPESNNKKPKTIRIAVQDGRTYNAFPEKQKPIDLFESLARDFKTLESSFNSEFSNFNSAERIRPFVPQTRSASVRMGDWSEETQDTWHRADGMRCTRTVTVTPGGRSVTTRCFKDKDGGRYPGQPHRRRRNYPITSFLTNVDDEFNYYFDRARRVFSQWF